MLNIIPVIDFAGLYSAARPESLVIRRLSPVPNHWSLAKFKSIYKIIVKQHPTNSTMQSKASTVSEYLSQLPDDRQKAVNQLVEVIQKNLPEGFEEVMGYGMPGWIVPHSLYPKGYHSSPSLPLPFLNLASQKNYISLYHMGLHQGKLLDWFSAKWKLTTTIKLDMGGSCIRFKKAEDIPFGLIGELVSKLTPQDWIGIYKKALTS